MVKLDLTGKKAVVMGVANKRSLGWAIATELADAGAELAFTYQGERLRGELEKLTADLPGTRLYECDVTNDDQIAAAFDDLGKHWDGIDALVHSIAFAPREALDGRYIDTTRSDWLLALEISAFSLVAVAKAAEPYLNEGASYVTLTYHAAEKVVPKYNVMAVSKSALEASVRYLAYELGAKGVRVNAISAGPMRTVAARSIPGFVKMYKAFESSAPLQKNVTHEDVGKLGLFLLSSWSGATTGEVVYADCGYNIMGMHLTE